MLWFRDFTNLNLRQGCVCGRLLGWHSSVGCLCVHTSYRIKVFVGVTLFSSLTDEISTWAYIFY